ncbi:transglycosylase SLT domain-containing protein [Aquimixticola soesokkakensis]
MNRRALLGAVMSCAVVTACGGRDVVSRKSVFDRGYNPPLFPNETADLRVSINAWADYYEVPRKLVHAQVQRESTHNPAARNGPYYGLMQILPQTARTMGFKGAPAELLDADTNLKYAVKYLRGAYLVADGDSADAMKWYARGYYYEAKRLGLLQATGLRS